MRMEAIPDGCRGRLTLSAEKASNALLRQYFPRKTDLSGYSQADLDKVALRLNQRPRKTLGFETPASKLQASVASTS
jgi:IS30 family transposase